MKPVGDRKRQRHGIGTLRLPDFAKRGPGPFIVAIEGPNGAGKTTLCRLISKSLGVPSCLGTDDAWFSKSFKTRMIRDADWFSSAMFFLSGCFERMRLLRESPDALVVMDRSIWSTLAVHGAESPGRLTALVAMLTPVADRIRVPDLTLVLEASFETCQARISRKSGEARVLDELTAAPDFHKREWEFYQWLARERPEVLFLDADREKAPDIASRAAAMIRRKAATRQRGARGGVS